LGAHLAVKYVAFGIFQQKLLGTRGYTQHAEHQAEPLNMIDASTVVWRVLFRDPSLLFTALARGEPFQISG